MLTTAPAEPVRGLLADASVRLARLLDGELDQPERALTEIGCLVEATSSCSRARRRGSATGE